MTEKGIQHFNEINEFYKNSQKQNEKWFKYCPVRQIDNKLIFDFIDGQNLESLVDLYVKNNDFDKVFKESARIEKQIKRTSFPKRTFLITDFGAKTDDEANPCHEAINQAILQCSLSGGGTVIVPKGTFYTGPITLKSNVNFHLEEGAVLKFSTDQSLYFPAVLTRWEGIDCYNAVSYTHLTLPTT